MFSGKLKYIVLLFTFHLAIVLNAQDTIVLETIRMSDDEKMADLLAQADTVDQVSMRLRLFLEALKIAERTPQANQLFDLNFSIGKIYAKEALNERALGYFKAADRQEVDLPKRSALDLELAAIYDKMEQPDSSSYFYKKVLSEHESKNDYNGKIQLHQKLVRMYMNNKKYEQALDENLKIKQLVEKEQDKELLPVIYNNIGYNFNFLKNYEKAVEYFQYAEQANIQLQINSIRPYCIRT